MGAKPGESFQIDCGTCTMRDTDVCRDCVVMAIINPPDGAIVFDAAEERAIRAMATAGLLPLVKYRPDSKAAG